MQQQTVLNLLAGSPPMPVTIQLSPSLPIPPPPPLAQDGSIVDAVRQRLTSKSRSSFLPKLRLPTKSPTKKENLPESFNEAESVSSNINALISDCTSITLDNTALQGEDDETKDRYKWAIVYENQRGQVIPWPIVSSRLN